MSVLVRGGVVQIRTPMPLQLRVCAWCDGLMGFEAPARAQADAETTHGLCADCTDQLLATLVPPSPRKAPRRRPRRRTTPALPAG